MIRFSNMAAAGLLPSFFSEDDPRPAREQIAEAYDFGGGWQPLEGWTLDLSRHQAIGRYPEDPPFREVSRAQLRDETLILFQYAFLAIVQPDGSFEIARVD
jgi:hypothetical protein